MPRFIVTGEFTQSAVQGLMQKPVDRTEAVGAIVEAAGGTLEHYFLTTGGTDFLLVAEADNVEDVIAAAMVAAASGAVANVQTQRAWTSAEFAAVAGKAGKIASIYVAPGG